MRRAGKMETARDRLARHYPRKGATPAQIKAWVAACQAVATPEERAEYEQTGRDIGALFRRIGVDPLTQQSHQREFKVSV